MRYAIVAGLALLACGCTTTDGAASGAGPAPTAKASGAQACTAFNPAALGLADAKVTYYPADPAKGLSANCNVSGTLHPVAGSNIGVVYRLPDAWNGKVYGIGGGGWAGNVTLQAGNDALKAGYATMQTDGGHPGTGVWDNAWAQNPEAAKDFSYRAIHEMTVAGKKFATAYYGRKFDNAYYVGCSTGGRMGLMEAQRYPDDYDAIVAGAPVYTLQTQTTGLMRTNAFGAPGAAFSADDLKLAQDSALAQCDASDGLKDGLINDPRACHWDPATIQCNDAKTASCLAAPQVAALRSLYDGIKSPDGQWAMWPISRGGETGWSFFIGTSGKPDTTGGGGLLGLKPLLFPNRDIDWAHFSAATDAPQVRSSAFAAMYEAKDPNLSEFFSHGGKLLVWHGESDPGPSPTGTLDYARVVMAQNARAAQQFRVFLAPGVGHCGGGPGADVLPVAETIDAWVHTGRAPESLIATKRDKSLTRLDCAWPKVAHYAGGGDPNDTTSWKCVARSGSGGLSTLGERG
ncbi:MAG TPA: tannase/feruloyl esterase family alpha/beta hydrolase [Croceibacterium sp.]|nr:tannase/feruloyl esterase family alpha/beta hydrolase [Croceibacterium sp.]